MLGAVAKSNNTTKSGKDDREGKSGSSKKSAKRGQGEKDPLEELIKKGMTISSMLPILMELTNHQYTDIDELIDNISEEVFESWLTDKCGVAL
jgi:hypothetical protein